ncbi:probable palmitoyltransferase ZDHHC24 [Uloborus diversus]|uniref:probable palmitoyltransferase ZDHHC24 n=1 Tax=Uloborus diversus TaxID=327109 RepID=UPI00240917C0|nr:probable palmitoyltransferase ZDHHC24 [Uloborus diversus]
MFLDRDKGFCANSVHTMEINEEYTLPLNKNDILPKNKLDRGLFVLMTVLIPALTVWETFILFQYYPELNFNVFIHFLFGSFLSVNVLGNLYYLKKIDSSAKQKSLPAVLHANWKYCHFCQLNSPPRSYHCPVCDECILKRDQHCMFAGCCVGFYNHRYYFLAVVYAMLGSLCAALFQLPHCLESIGGFHLLPMLSLAAPHISLLFGFLSFYGFICAITQIVLLSAVVLTTYLLIVQIRCISNGQTIHEKKADIRLYDLGLKKNFIQILGMKWFIAIFWPFVSSPIKGDGMQFLTFYDLQEIKNV